MSAATLQRLLLVAPDSGSRVGLRPLLEREGYELSRATSLDGVLDEAGVREVDAALIDVAAIGSDPAGAIRRLKERTRQVPVVLLAPPERIEQAVAWLRHGADDYVIRPVDPFELQIRLGRLLERGDLDSRLHFFQGEISKKSSYSDTEARSPAMIALRDRMRRVGPMRSTVLIYGESGVGKELVARSLHFNSPRQDEAFVALNCAAIPPGLIESELFGHERGSFTGAHARMRGKFEIAHRGTIFLDEIGEMDPSTQAKLLRLLEQREFMRIGGNRSVRVDVRVIAATNADLDALVAGSAFRRDLYYRLKVVTLKVPPLRDRREDIPALVRTFVDQISKANAVPPKRIEPSALAAMMDHSWPGNVRELKNLIESLLVAAPGNVIRPDDLPETISGRRRPTSGRELAPGTTLADMERELIRRTLEFTGGNRTHGAELLGIGVRTLQRKLAAYGLAIPPRRRRPRRRPFGEG